MGSSSPIYPRATAWERGLDLIFPPTCVGCGRVGRWICAECWNQLTWLLPTVCATCTRPWTGEFCPMCGGHVTSLDGMLASVAFDGVGREAVHALKYHGRHAIAGMMGQLMAGTIPDISLSAVVPVTLHPTRRRERGYDQAEMLALKVARSIDLPCLRHGLRRIRATRQQVSLDAVERHRNVAGAFAASSVVVEGERILLVDDVTTTGSTLEAAALALRDAGAASVTALVFASAALP